MAKEGESYLDELLNAVAPDWEETSISPESLMEDFNDDMEGEVSLEDALTILDDLPDSESEYLEEIGGEDEFGDWGGTDSDLPADIENDSETGAPELPHEDELPVMEEAQDESMMPADIPIPESEELPVMMDGKEEEAAQSEPEEPPLEEEEEDIPLDLDPSVMGEDESAGEDPVSVESVDVDDIFQDALSAVTYSGKEDEDEDEQDESLLAFDPLDEFMESPAEDVASIPAADPMSREKRKKDKNKPGFFARIFGNIITDATADEEEKERQAEQEAQEAKAKAKEEKKKQAELSKEEKTQLAAENKERKKQLKAEQAAKKAEEKEEKKRLKEERKAEEAANEVVGKINPVGAAIVVIFFATIGIFTLFGSMLLSRNSSLNQAENYFANGEYTRAYDVIHTANMVEEDDVLYRRIRICSQLQKELNSYTNYASMGMKVEALDSLVKGFHHYNLNKGAAEELEIIRQFDALKNEIETNLSREFSISREEAEELLLIEDRGEYTRRIEEIAGRAPAA